MTERYTPEQLKDLVKQYDYDCGADDYHYSGRISDALHQAASDAARIAELEADRERLDWCESNPEHENMPYFEGANWWVPYLHRGQSGVGGGVSSASFKTLRAAIDAARSRT